MPEDLAERLSRFTPDGSGLDRDALLFAAGRASVRPPRCWAAVAGALAACQVLTLILLWPRPSPPHRPLATTPPRSVVVREPSRPADPDELGSLNRRLLASGADDLAPQAPVESLAPAAPPLTTFTAAPPAGLDR
jgi:hypothetical protein